MKSKNDTSTLTIADTVLLGLYTAANTVKNGRCGNIGRWDMMRGEWDGKTQKNNR